MFSTKSITLLEAMRIDSNQYYKELMEKFGCDAKHFVEIIEHFDDPSKVGDIEKFLDFCKPRTIDESSLLFDWLFEFYNNLRRYFEGGVFCLFKRRQSEWGASQVGIKRSDVPLNSDLDTLNEVQTVYRGLSLAEHHGKDYAQSWTTDLTEAQKFSKGRVAPARCAKRVAPTHSPLRKLEPVPYLSDHFSDPEQARHDKSGAHPGIPWQDPPHPWRSFRSSCRHGLGSLGSDFAYCFWAMVSDEERTAFSSGTCF